MKIALLWLQRLFLLSSISFLIYILIRNKTDVIEVFSVASFPGIAFGIAFWIVATLLMPFIALIILQDKGNTVSYATLLSIHLNRIPSKFLPGGVWQTLARAYDMNNLSISKTDISLVVLYDSTYSIILAAIASTLGIYLLDSNTLYSQLALFLFIASLLTIPAAFAFRKRNFILSGKAYLRLTVICIFFWIATSTAFYNYMTAIGLVNASSNPLLVVVHYLFAYVVGFVSIFAPQGIGVFEVVIAELVDLNMPLTQVIVLVAGFRVLVMASDILSWLAYMLLRFAGQLGDSSSD